MKDLIRFEWALKRLLRNKANYTVLEGFLSVLLNDDIKIVKINESEGNKEHPEDKFNRVDMLVENSRGELFIIELQNNEEVDYYFRMLYGVSKAITEHIFSGDAYAKVRKVYHINIIYFQMGDGKDYVYQGTTEFRGIHSGALLPLTPKQKEFFGKEEVKDLYPEYYILCVEGFDDVAKNSLDEWMYYLKNTEIPDSFTARGLPEARERLRYDRLTKEEKTVYDHYVDQARHERGVLFTSYFNGKFDGRAEGIEVGRQEGMEVGRQEGIEVGRTENAVEIAEKMLKDGMSIDSVCRYTGLSKEQVEEIARRI
jgi:hypothetical protein